MIFLKRAIILFPNFDNINIIKSIREKYDPLANCIEPHITIVFPFDSDISTDDLKSHFNKVLKGVKKFNVKLKDFTGDFRDGYLFLNVKKGNDNIIELHDKLYSGILEYFLFRKVTYCPHLTVGRLHKESEFDKALDELRSLDESFEIIIDKIYIENIDIMEHSTIEFSFDLE
ncbi:2'-5' RNA ligase family protein [Clostridium sp. YIM B02555]|uniref:2'-5' RNA ligase family protein n=1 Tax=Clostridium sp. YIM B02555 TaxID=2911968 RepID=UPI001EED8088